MSFIKDETRIKLAVAPLELDATNFWLILGVAPLELNSTQNCFFT